MVVGRSPVEVPLHLTQLASGADRHAVAEVLREAYAGCDLVRVSDAAPATIAIEDDAATDRMTLHVFGNDDLRQLRLVATLDNLGKGAAGAAVQNLNLMAGLDPLAGLAR